MLLDETALEFDEVATLELDFLFAELLDEGLLELELVFPLEEELDAVLFELLEIFAELEIGLLELLKTFAELEFTLFELLDEFLTRAEDDETALVEDDDLSFWKLEELIETIELLDLSLLELETSLLELESIF